MKFALVLLFAALAPLASLAHGQQTQPASPLQAEIIGLFEERVQAAQAAEDDQRYRSYQPAMVKRAGRHLTRTMRRCSAAVPKPEQAEERDAFVLVADITAKGTAAAVEVKPDNAVSRCFAKGFSAARFPAPPRHHEREAFPVMMKVRMAP